MSKINLIVAIDEERGIAKDGEIPWYLPKDLEHFRNETLNSTVILGRKTFENVQGNLDNREKVVLSRLKNFDDESVTTCKDIASAVEEVDERDTEAYVIGGAEVYRNFVMFGLVDEMIITEVKGTYDCDTFFPMINDANWVTSKVDRFDNFDIKYLKPRKERGIDD